MQSAQEFIESFLREKAVVFRLTRQACHQFDKKFFSESIVTCRSNWNEDRNRNLESVSLIDTSNDTVSFITTELIFRRTHRKRYHLRISENKWEIHKQEDECFLCKGTGLSAEKPCRHCHGIGWKDYSQEIPEK